MKQTEQKKHTNKATLAVRPRISAQSAPLGARRGPELRNEVVWNYKITSDMTKAARRMLLQHLGYMSSSLHRLHANVSAELTQYNVALLTANTNYNSSVHSKTSTFLLGRSCTDGLISILSGQGLLLSIYAVSVLILMYSSPFCNLLFSRRRGRSGAYPRTTRNARQLVIRSQELAELVASPATHGR